MKNLNRMNFGGEDDDQQEETGDVFGVASSSSADKGPKIPKLPLTQPNELSASDIPAQSLSANSVNFLLNTDRNDRKSQANEQIDSTESFSEPEPVDDIQEHYDPVSEATTDQQPLTQSLQNEQSPEASLADVVKDEEPEPVEMPPVETPKPDAVVDVEPETADELGGNGGRGNEGGEVPPSSPAGKGGGENIEQPPQQVVAAAHQEATPNQSSTTVIERGDAAGPAIVAFLAANYFRRRDKRRQKRINRNLNKQIEEAQQQTVAERERAQATKRQAEADLQAQRARLESLEQRHAQLQAEQGKQQEALQTVSELDGSSNDAAVKVSEVIAAAPAAQEIVKRLRRHQESSVPEPTEHEDTGDLRLPAMLEAQEIVQPDTLAELHKDDEPKRRTSFEEVEQQLPQTETMHTSEQQAELPPLQPVEKIRERRHEAKDDPRIAKQLALGTAAPQTAASATHATSNLGSATSFTPPPLRGTSSQSRATHVTATTNDDLYRRSIANGVLMGVITIIIGAFAYLLFG